MPADGSLASRGNLLHLTLTAPLFHRRHLQKEKETIASATYHISEAIHASLHREKEKARCCNTTQRNADGVSHCTACSSSKKKESAPVGAHSKGACKCAWQKEKSKLHTCVTPRLSGLICWGSVLSIRAVFLIAVAEATIFTVLNWWNPDPVEPSGVHHRLKALNTCKKWHLLSISPQPKGDEVVHKQGRYILMMWKRDKATRVRRTTNRQKQITGEKQYNGRTHNNY